MALAVFGTTLVAWVLLFLTTALLLARDPRPNPAPTTLTPGSEAPAIVDLLVHGWKPTPAACVATLVDLAARGHLRLTTEPLGRLLCGVASATPSEPLAPFEDQLLLYVASRNLGDAVPAAALLPDLENDDGQRWVAKFRLAVIDEARRLGLVSDRLPRPVRWAMGAAATVPAVALGWWIFGIFGISGHDQPAAAAAVEIVVLCLLFAFGLVAIGLQLVHRRLWATPLGRKAASRWLGVRAALLRPGGLPHLPEVGAPLDDRLLAWALVLDATPDLMRALDPAAHEWVWSSEGGRWRQLRVSGSPHGSVSRPWRSEPGAVGQRTLTGRVIRRWRKRQLDFGSYSYERELSYDYYLAVDDGRSDEASVWRVSEYEYQRFQPGVAVQIMADPEGRMIQIAEAILRTEEDQRPTFDADSPDYPSPPL